MPCLYPTKQASKGKRHHSITVLPSFPANQPLPTQQTQPSVTPEQALQQPAAMSCNSNTTENGNGSSSDSTALFSKREPPSSNGQHSPSKHHQHHQQKQKQKQEPSATLWEHFVLHKASESKLRIFDLTIEDEKPKPEPGAKMSALATATANLMGMLGENQRSDSASSLLASDATPITTTTTTSTTPNQKATTKSKAPADAIDTTTPLLQQQQQQQQQGSLPAAFLASLASAHSLSQNTTSTTTTASTSKFAKKNKPNNDDSPLLPLGPEKIFGPAQALALNPSVRRFDAARQEMLVRDANAAITATTAQRHVSNGGAGGVGIGVAGIDERPPLSKRRLHHFPAGRVLGSAFAYYEAAMISGGLDEGDGRCVGCSAAAAAAAAAAGAGAGTEEKEVV